MSGPDKQLSISQTEAHIAELRAEAGRLQKRLIHGRIKAASPKAASDRQRRLCIATICNASWLDTHTARFIRLARRAMPDATYALVFVGTEAELTASKTPEQFDRVIRRADKAATGYLHYNALRYRLCSTLGRKDVVYIDPDIDIVSDISHIPNETTATIGWCRSPIEPQGFGDAMRKLGLNGDGPWSNSGTLLLRGDFAKQYAEAAAKLERIGFTPRMIGNAAFSAMLRQGGIDHAELPYKYGTIWWDKERLSRALCVHYCNDHGKARRDMLEKVWVG